MKTLHFLSLILTALLILFSCSNDDSESTPDIIIGKWRAIEKYESNVQVDLPTCLPHIYTEYKADKSIIGDRIVTDAFPEDCSLIEFELGWNWDNLGDNQYRIRFLEEQGQVVTFYKEGDNLVEESPDGITKLVYETY